MTIWFLVATSLLASTASEPDWADIDFSALRHPVGRTASLSSLTELEADDHDYDVLHYDLEIEIFPETEELVGITGVELTPTTSISQIRLDFVQMTVDQVWDSGGSLSFTQQADSVFVDLDGTYGPGDTLEVFLSYSGTPWNEGPGKFGGFWFHPYVSYHMGVGVYTDPPSMGRCMFPCWDHLSDKALFDFHITVDDSVYVVANGDLTGIDYSGGKATYHWTVAEPMSTYLAAIAASDYVDLVDSTYSWIHYYVYPWEVEDALGSFVNVDLMMDTFESLFVPYPWSGKFSYVETPKGDMEHTGEVYHYQMFINGSTNFDPIVAHEMGHMWWGNCVTESDWPDVWLSEGFATYCEALWAETYGAQSYEDYMVNQIMIPYLQSGEMFPLADPEELWGYTTYEKGASVLHMLRHVIGDTDFFDSLLDYYNHHMFDLATSLDLRDHIENITGEDIDWFFDTWVFDWGYPIYDIDYSWEQSGSDWDVTISIDQIQTVGPFFEMPIDFQIQGAGEDTMVVMLNDVPSDVETFTVPFEPLMVRFDPGNWILSTALLGIEDQPAPPPGGTGTMRLLPNPTTGPASISWPGIGDAEMDVRIFDLSGRLVHEQHFEAAASRQVDLERLPAGTYLLEARCLTNLRQVARLIVL